MRGNTVVPVGVILAIESPPPSVVIHISPVESMAPWATLTPAGSAPGTVVVMLLE